jgi:hypothetical protein
MIVEGVLNGSHGPLLHLAEEFGKIPESWNGIPVVINHPEINGQNVSANDPVIIDTQTVGRIYNAKLEDNKLKAEAWLDEDKLTTISAKTLALINATSSIEVSVGVYTEDEETSGEWNGIKYNAVARNHKPDHLALLPDGIGACSLEDGCGIRANQLNKGGGNHEMIEINREVLGEVRRKGYSISIIALNMASGLREKLDELYDLVQSLNTKGADGYTNSWHYLEEAYDTYLIYSEDGEGKEQKCYRVNYQYDEATGEPTFVGDHVEVERKVIYETVPNTNFKTNKKMEVCTPCVEKKVKALIANKATLFTDADKEWLQNLSEEQLDRMIPEIPVQPIATMSAEDTAALEFGKKLLAQRRAEMISGIQANTADGLWPEAILLDMNETMLERIYNSVKKESVVVDYSLNGNSRKLNDNTSKVEGLYPGGIEMK